MELAIRALGASPLIVLIEQNNIRGVETLLTDQNLNTLNDDKQTPLHYAIELGHIDIANMLLDRKPDVNTRDKDKWSPLISAAKLGDLNLVKKLMELGAQQFENDENEVVDMGGWSAVTWASYKGHVNVLDFLLNNQYQKGDASSISDFGMAPLIWASGRGHADCVELLLKHGADVQKSDKFGSTALFWACRKGHLESVKLLLKADVDVNAVGANGQNSVIVAAKNGHVDCVDELLRYSSNVNQTDKDGNSALSFACASGEYMIVDKLLASGAYLNHPNHKEDTPLILATRHGHASIVRALLSRNCNVNHAGNGNKTALYWAADNSKADIVKELLKHDTDTEIQTFDGETCLLRAVKNRYSPIVDALLRKGAKVSARDSRGDTPLHISLRSKNKTITEMLLRNPRDSRLLYKMNYDGETPYQIDLTNKKSILTQIFGTKSLSDPLTEQSDFSQYDLYSSALADILSEPTLTPPITVGVYAQWGSGKSFLLKKLADIMNSFVGETGLLVYYFSPFWLLPLFIVAWIAAIVGISVVPAKRGIILPSFILPSCAVYIIFIIVVRYGQNKWDWIKILADRMKKFEEHTKLILNLLFYQGYIKDAADKDKPVRFLFTDYSRLSSVGSETSLAEMVGALCKTTERNFGVMATRIYRAMKPRDDRTSSRKACCLPLSLVFSLLVIDLICLTIFAALDLSPVETTNDVSLFKSAYWTLGALGVFFSLLLLLSLWPILYHLAISPYRRILNAAARVNNAKGSGSYESFMICLKKEVEHLAGMVNAFDCIGPHQTRLVVEVNGLDSCEQDRVLDVLETVNVLFTQSPYIVILAIDDNIIVKAVDRNLNQRAQLEINGRDYLRNMIHLPFYMQDQSIELLKRQKQLMPSIDDKYNRPSQVVQPREGFSKSIRIVENEVNQMNLAGSSSSLFGQNNSGQGNNAGPQSPTGITDSNRELRRRKKKVFEEEKRVSIFGNELTDSQEFESTRVSRAGGHQNAFDLTKMLATEDWFSSISPQIMKRILNVVSLTGRLLRANRLQFTWERLAAWINMTEVWPYRTSWIVLYIEETEEVEPKTLLKSVYQQVLPFIPISTQQEPLLEIDNADSRQLEVFLSAREPQLTVRDVIRFLPCTVNLDPKLREWIVDWQATKKTLGDNTSPYTQPDQSQQTGLLTLQRPQQQSTMGSMNPATFDTTLSTSLGQSPMTNQAPMFSTLPRQTSQNGRTLLEANAEQFHQWIGTVPGMTESGQKKVAKFVARENVSGFVLDQLKGNYECIISGAQLNLGDGMILANAIYQHLHQPVIPQEIENFSIPVPAASSPHSSVEMDFRMDPMGGVDLAHHQGY